MRKGVRTLQPETDSFELNNFLAIYPHPPTLPCGWEGGRGYISKGVIEE